ncbi:MAG TPA: TetR family transcriptional regulator [Candidatus Aquabacterium excrementipullorum]|nr:TetR family transcriptional regulator [Candidatus Aquabacterium excrementipullorum]
MRRTKEDAQLTREKLLDTAEVVFSSKGVARTSLQDIAQAAGLTRGAIYWHFQDKAALFSAMMDRIVTPMEQALKDLTEHPGKDPLAQVRDAMLVSLRLICEDERTRRVMGIAVRQAPFVGEMAGALERRLEVHLRCRGYIENAVRSAQSLGLAQPGVSPRGVATSIMAVVTGLIDLWMLEPSLFPLVESGQETLDVYLAGLKSVG